MSHTMWAVSISYTEVELQDKIGPAFYKMNFSCMIINYSSNNTYIHLYRNSFVPKTQTALLTAENCKIFDDI